MVWLTPAMDGLVEYDRIRRTPQTSVRALAVAFPALGASYYRLPINQLESIGGDLHIRRLKPRRWRVSGAMA